MKNYRSFEAAVCSAALGLLLSPGLVFASRSEAAVAQSMSQLVRQFTLRTTVSQVNQGLQGLVVESGGKLRGPAMAAAGTNFPADMGTVPAAWGLPSRDGAGRLLGYCAWDNNSGSNGSSYLGGSLAVTPIVYAVLSPGLDGVVDTSCADIASNFVASGDDYVEIRYPQNTASQQFKTSVSTVAALATTAGVEGDVRLVLENNKLYSYDSGSWVEVSTGGPRSFSDNSATNGAGAISYTTGKVTVAQFEATAATFSSNINVTGTSTLNGAVTAANGITVSGGGINVTGASSITGATTITGTLSVSGGVTATSFSGNGSALTNLNASNISSGVLSAANGGTGVNASAASNGALLIGNGSGFTLGMLTGSNGRVKVTNSAGSIGLDLSTTGVVSGTYNNLTIDMYGRVISSRELNFNDLTNMSAVSNGSNIGNSALGSSSMRNLASANNNGSNNTAMGFLTLTEVTQGSGNTAMGQRSLRWNEIGSDNTAIGNISQQFYGGNRNSSLGSAALNGYYCCYASVLSNDNTGVGFSAGFLNLGNNNTFLGSNADLTTLLGINYATAIGSYAKVSTDNTIVLGRTSDATVIGATGTASSGILQNKKLQVTGDVGVSGALALNGALTGTTGTFTQNLTARRLDIGDSTGGVNMPNLVIGSGAMAGTPSGSGANIAFGVNALAANTSGESNIALGENSLLTNTTSSLNIAIGGSVMRFATPGNENIGIGGAALAYNASTGNVGIGRSALYLNTTGAQNTALGYYAGYTTIPTTGSFNTFIGNEARASDTAAMRGSGRITLLGANSLALGLAAATPSAYMTAIGANAQVTSVNTIVLGRTADMTVIGATGTDGSGNILQVTGSVKATAFNTSSDRRLKTDINQLSDSLLENLSSMSAYSYRFITDASNTMRYGVVAQEIAPLFPYAVSYDKNGIMAVDYGALGAIAAAGVGKLNIKLNTLSTQVNTQGEKLTALEKDLLKVDDRVKTLEAWKTDTAGRLDTMQTAINLNIEKIAEYALKIATNTEKITTLETATQDLGTRMGTAENGLAKLNAQWAGTFAKSEDGNTLTVLTPNLVASNFSADQVRARSAYTERLEAEMARIATLEVDDLRANKATTGNLRAAEVNTGSAQVFASTGSPTYLFTTAADGHYTVNVNAADGSYVTASVMVSGGLAKVVTVSNDGIDLLAEGTIVKAVANGKLVKASWIKMG